MNTQCSTQRLLAAAALSLALAGLHPTTRAQADETIDLTGKTLSVTDAQNGLFPDDACEDLKAHGFKCMGYKPPVKYSLPAASFRLGSAELPATLRNQLDVFAEALRGKTGNDHAVRIEGHADASGSAAGNKALSQRRAEAARTYLVARGVAPGMLKAVGLGSEDLIDQQHPRDATNRRVVIGRDQPPPAPAAQN